MRADHLSRRVFLKRLPASLAGFSLLSSLPSWAFAARAHSRAFAERSFFAMGSVATIRAFGEDRAHLHHALTLVIEEFQRLERELSIFLPASQVSRANALAGRDKISVGEDFLEIAEWSVSMSKQTMGSFDITVGPLMHAWGFRGEPVASMPSDREIARLLECVGWDKIVLDRPRNTIGLLKPGAKVDLGGIGVGYALDRSAAILKAQGVSDAFLNHSGDAVALGSADEEDGWEIGIPDPRQPDRIAHRMILRDQAVATSGGYRQSFTLGSKTFSHLIDPRSGIPGAVAWSTTVVAPKAMHADALSTSLFHLSPNDQQAVLDHFPQTSFIEMSHRGQKRTLRS